MKRLIATGVIAALVLILGIVWGCSGTSSERAAVNPNSDGTTGIIVSPAPTTGNTTGTTGNNTGAVTTGSTSATGSGGNPSTSTGSTTGNPTTGNTATSGATNTNNTTATGTTTATGGNTGTTTGGNQIQIPVVNSHGGFPFAFTSPVNATSGDMVVWVNQTAANHGITWDAQVPSSSPPPGNNIPIFGPGTTSAAWQVPTVTVQTAYNYHCTVHGTSMKGVINVSP